MHKRYNLNPYNHHSQVLTGRGLSENGQCLICLHPEHLPTLSAEQAPDITRTAREYGRTYTPHDPNAERHHRERELNRTEEHPNTDLVRGDDFIKVTAGRCWCRIL